MGEFFPDLKGSGEEGSGEKNDPRKEGKGFRSPFIHAGQVDPVPQAPLPLAFSWPRERGHGSGAGPLFRSARHLPKQEFPLIRPRLTPPPLRIRPADEVSEVLFMSDWPCLAPVREEPVSGSPDLVAGVPKTSPAESSARTRADRLRPDGTGGPAAPLDERIPQDQGDEEQKGVPQKAGRKAPSDPRSSR